MKGFILLAFILFTRGVQAETTQDKIFSIARGKGREPHLIKYVSGKVDFVEHDQKGKLALLEAKLKAQKLFSKSVDHNKLLLDPGPDFGPSILSDADIQSVYQRLNKYMRRKSECSDRAHAWSYDEFKRSGTKSEKVFLFLTDAYIRRNRYKWFFHVAPLFTNPAGEKIVTDAQFFDRPVQLNEWKNSLVFSKRECVTDFRFLDYNAGADQTQDCYVKILPMYYRIPQDIGSLENGSPRTGWNVSEVNATRSRAFFKGSIQ